MKANANAKANFFFGLCRCSTWTLNRIFYEPTWYRCRFWFPSNINEPLRPIHTVQQRLRQNSLTDITFWDEVIVTVAAYEYHHRDQQNLIIESIAFTFAFARCGRALTCSFSCICCMICSAPIRLSSIRFRSISSCIRIEFTRSTWAKSQLYSIKQPK